MQRQSTSGVLYGQPPLPPRALEQQVKVVQERRERRVRRLLPLARDVEGQLPELVAVHDRRWASSQQMVVDIGRWELRYAACPPHDVQRAVASGVNWCAGRARMPVASEKEGRNRERDETARCAQGT